MAVKRNLRRWGAAGILVGALGLLLTCSTLQFHHHADSLVPVLISTQHWSLFYWGQNRFGTLLPLLAAPVANPLHNLYVQSFLNAAAAAAWFFLLARWLGGPRGMVAGGLWGMALFLMLLNDRQTTDFLSLGQPYALALALGAGAVLLLDPAEGGRQAALRITAGFSLLLLACWGNLALWPLLATMVMGAWLLRPHPLRAWRAGLVVAGVLAAVVCANYLAARCYPLRSPRSLDFSTDDFWRNLGAILGNVVRGRRPWPWVQAGAGVLLLGGIGFSAFQRRRALSCRRLAALGAGIVVFLAMLASSQWIALNQSHPRYAAPAVAGLCAALATAALAGGLARRHAAWRWLAMAMGALLLAGVVLRAYPPRSPAAGRAFLNQRFGRFTIALREHAVRVVYGDFRDVWPAVFHYNWSAYEQGRPDRMCGLTDRCANTRPAWYPLLESGAPAAHLVHSPWPRVPGNEQHQREADMAAPLVFREESRVPGLVFGRFVAPDQGAAAGQ